MLFLHCLDPCIGQVRQLDASQPFDSIKAKLDLLQSASPWCPSRVDPEGEKIGQLPSWIPTLLGPLLPSVAVCVEREQKRISTTTHIQQSHFVCGSPDSLTSFSNSPCTYNTTLNITWRSHGNRRCSVSKCVICYFLVGSSASIQLVFSIAST